MKQYDTYKDSGIEWIGEIPSHWEVKKIKQLTNTLTGSTPKSTEESYWNGDINWVTTDDLGKLETKYIFESRRKITKEGFENSGTYLAPEGSIVISTRAPIGHLGILRIEACTNQGCKTIVANPNYNPEFFYYFLYTGKGFLNSLGVGTTFLELPTQTLKDFLIPFPKIEEQIAIATYLDRKTAEIDALITDKKRLLELYEEEKTAVINQAVTKGIDPKAKMKDSGIEWLGEIPEHWEVKRFKYFFRLITEKKENDLLKIGLENIESKTGKFIKTDAEFEGQGISFKLKDILFGKLRPYLAKVWLSEFDGQAVGDFYVFRAKENVLPEFAKYRILDSSFIEIVNSSTYGSKMPRVSWEFISDLFIAFPNSKEQQSIVRHIEIECTRIDAKIAKTQRLIELLTEYRTALISEVVTGKIKVTD
ncbi:restriction endonuclease subunit S [Chryseobacterium koreense]|uniref:restriction endonuclease subunit S n=1 Tax=Chryseobacterium koreense TaxID=232216 RepID=UPI0026E9AE8C|nr:restriction endonuclease subunit S [Chryseobacterium koreense]